MGSARDQTGVLRPAGPFFPSSAASVKSSVERLASGSPAPPPVSAQRGHLILGAAVLQLLAIVAAGTLVEIMPDAARPGSSPSTRWLWRRSRGLARRECAGQERAEPRLLPYRARNPVAGCSRRSRSPDHPTRLGPRSAAGQARPVNARPAPVRRPVVSRACRLGLARASARDGLRPPYRRQNHAANGARQRAPHCPINGLAPNATGPCPPKPSSTHEFSCRGRPAGCPQREPRARPRRQQRADCGRCPEPAPGAQSDLVAGRLRHRPATAVRLSPSITPGEAASLVRSLQGSTLPAPRQERDRPPERG
jgi:hypothetical protein